MSTIHNIVASLAMASSALAPNNNLTPSLTASTVAAPRSPMPSVSVSKPTWPVFPTTTGLDKAIETNYVIPDINIFKTEVTFEAGQTTTAPSTTATSTTPTFTTLKTVHATARPTSQHGRQEAVPTKTRASESINDKTREMTTPDHDIMIGDAKNDKQTFAQKLNETLNLLHARAAAPPPRDPNDIKPWEPGYKGRAPPVSNTTTPDMKDYIYPDWYKNDCVQHTPANHNNQLSYRIRTYNVPDVKGHCDWFWWQMAEFDPACRVMTDTHCEEPFPNVFDVKFKVWDFCTGGMVQSAWWELTENAYGSLVCREWEAVPPEEKRRWMVWEGIQYVD